jgi:hypothetical protein
LDGVAITQQVNLRIDLISDRGRHKQIATVNALGCWRYLEFFNRHSDQIHVGAVSRPVNGAAPYIVVVLEHLYWGLRAQLRHVGLSKNFVNHELGRHRQHAHESMFNSFHQALLLALTSQVLDVNRYKIPVIHKCSDVHGS